MNPLLLLGLAGGAWLLLKKPTKPTAYDVLFQTPAALPSNVDTKPQLFAALFGPCGAKSITSSLTAPQPGRYVYSVTLDRECPLPQPGQTIALHYAGGMSIPATVLTAQVAPVAPVVVASGRPKPVRPPKRKAARP